MSTAPTITEVDGVEVHWRESPGRLRASLVFRVGAVDEEFHTLGLSHLVEHLAFSEAEDLDPDTDGSTGVQTTRFDVGGSPEKVAAHLASICRSLSALADGTLPAARIEHEKRILAAEGNAAALPSPSIGEALGTRYGLRGPGLAGIPAPMVQNIGEDEVHEWARTRFTAQNAVLVLTGEPPAGLTLPLPSGTRRAVPTFGPVVHAAPAEYPSGGEELVLSFEVPGDDDALEAVARVALKALERRCFRELRRDAGVVYGTDAGLALQPGSGLCVVTVRTAPASVREAGAGVLAVLRSIRDGGVAAEDLEAAVQDALDQLEDPEGLAAELETAAVDALSGRPHLPLEKAAEALRAVTPQDIAAYLSRLDSTLLVGVPGAAYPHEPEPGQPGLLATVLAPAQGPEVSGQAHPAKLIARLAGAPRGLRLTVGKAGLAITDGATPRSLAWDDVVGLEHDTSDPAIELLRVIGLTGDVIEVPLTILKGADQALEAIHAHVPARRRISVTEPHHEPAPAPAG
ncbi:M16 family metallopeptidase [Sinomonas halotolerans]|uniref:Insulinase family protein n=1 Tax=Sinomonas halotolerans TaxID=1644133 RepID=A0ABU9X4U0_9MICC